MLPNVYASLLHESDMLKVTAAGYLTEYEIKLSKSDLRADFTGKARKHATLQEKQSGGVTLKHFYFVGPPEIFEGIAIPPKYGIIHATNWQRHKNAATYVVLRTYRRAGHLPGHKPIHPSRLQHILRKICWRYCYQVLPM